MQSEIRNEFEAYEIIGESSMLKSVLRQTIDAAKTEAPVLIVGESGSGKELIARAIHRLGSRRLQSFIKVDCTIVGPAQLEAVLLQNDGGRIEGANHGTFLLKRAESVSQNLQAKLLQVFGQKELQSSQERTTLLVDIRLIATVTDTGQKIEETWLYKGLAPHVNPSVIRVPALRERPSDIPLLATFFVSKWARRAKKSVDSIPTDTMSALANYSWPDNVRELESLIAQSVVSIEGHELHLEIPAKKKRA
jgi:formate hydrogenlyase transcriptional activator